jgi:hypothetical protein
VLQIFLAKTCAKMEKKKTRFRLKSVKVAMVLVKLFENQEKPFRNCLQTIIRMMNLSTVLEMTLEIVPGTTIQGSGNQAEFTVDQDRGGQIALSSQLQLIQPTFTKQ